VVAPRHRLLQVPGKVDASVLDTEKMSGQGHAGSTERSEMQIVAAAMSGGQDVGEQPRRRVLQRAQRRIPKAGLDDPPLDVLVAQAAGRPGRPATGEDDVTAGLVEF